jgi:SAM-dependent MidA family methyltransferase
LLLAVEWLDTQPVDVVVGGRTLMVQPDGTQLPGQAPTSRDEAWLRRWWPDGDRREVGHRRDDAWAAAVRRLRAGIAVAVDYGHTRDCRPSSGSLAGYAAGRTVSALPDGHRDVTAAVALDACAAAVAADRPELAERSLITTQRAALRALGIEGRLPARPADGTAGAEYAADLQRAARAGRLLDPDGLGGFGWLLHAVDVPPATLSLLGCRP